MDKETLIPSLENVMYNFILQAFNTGLISDDQSKVIAEEKDLNKLKLDKPINRIIAVPVLDRQNGLPLAVISLYNPN